METTGFPTLDGTYRLSADWQIGLPGEFQRRFEGDSLVLWRSGMTARIEIKRNEGDEPKETRLHRLQQGAGNEALDAVTETNGALIRYAYRRRAASDASAATFHGFAIGNSGQAEIAVRCDGEADLETARQMWRGLREVEPPTGGCS